MPARPRRRDPQLTRERILAAARQLLADGDGNFEMAWVAKATGVSQGLAYHHFGSKEGLLTAVVNDFYDRVEASVLMARLEEIKDWEERERERTGRYIDFLLGDPLGMTVITRLARTPAVAVVEAERWDKLVTVGARNIAEGQSSGAVPSRDDSELLAAMVLGAVRAAVARSITAGRTRQTKQLAADIWRFVRRGLGMEETT